jgi:hypothetical protein
MELSGKIVNILDEFRTQSGKVKYGFLLETGGQYPQKIPFDVWGDERWSQMGVTVGSFVNVSFDISSREWNGKYFVSLGAWKVVRTDVKREEETPRSAESQGQAPAPQQKKEQTRTEAKEDDLPF